jgi:transcription elongation factor GreA
VIVAIQEARAQGDLSENAEYDAAKEKQGKIEAKIAELEDKIVRAYVIEADAAASETVIFGATVTVIDKATGKDTEYQLVGPEDVDFARNRIPSRARSARALVGKRRGDVVEFATPRGTKNLTIRDFR